MLLNGPDVQKKNETKDKFPIKYRPLPYQEEFHNDRYEILNRGVFGGRGSGKSFAGAFEAISWALLNPGSEGLVFEPTEKNFRI